MANENSYGSSLSSLRLVRHLPTWFPGAGFKRKAVQWRAKMEEFVDKPYEMVQERMVSFVHFPNPLYTRDHDRIRSGHISGQWAD